MARRRTSADHRPTVWVVGPMSPMVTGAARVTELVTAAVEVSGRVRVRRIDTGTGSTGPGLAGTVRRLSRMLLGLGRLLVVPRRSGAVYVGGAGGEVLWYQAVIVLLARLAGLRTVFHHHSYYYLTHTRWSMRVISTFGGRSLMHVVLCPGMGDVLTRRYPSASQVMACSNAGLLGPARTTVDRTGDGPLTLGHLSNLTIEKGVGRVLGTVRLLRAGGVPVRLVLAGPAASPEAEAVVAEALAELGDDLVVMGRVSPDSVDDFYRQIDVFVFPSLYDQEAEPLVVLDAGRNGIPTIAHAVGCLPGMVAPDHAIGSTDSFAERAAALLTGADAPARSSAVADTFTARRNEALEAHARLVTHLTHPASGA